MEIDKGILKNVSIASPNFMEEDYSLDWSMTRNERYCLTKLLEKIKPKVAIEIGIYNGGSLQVLSENAEKVYAIDIDINTKKRLGDRFKNVEFLIGDSKVLIPELLEELQKKEESIEFALIDGDHSAFGVKSDIENLIKYVPSTSMNIILHDSFNPFCRKGMKSVNYSANKHIHYVELDYVTGVFEPDGLKNQLWGGFAHIVLLKDFRNGELQVNQSQRKLYNLAFLHSKHFLKYNFEFLKPLLRLLKKTSYNRVGSR